jgi:hypothetical protein
MFQLARKRRETEPCDPERMNDEQRSILHVGNERLHAFVIIETLGCTLSMLIKVQIT